LNEIISSSPELLYPFPHLFHHIVYFFVGEVVVKGEGDGGRSDALGYGEIAGFVAEHFSVKGLREPACMTSLTASGMVIKYLVTSGWVTVTGPPI
jgi:hypothetical protein